MTMLQPFTCTIRVFDPLFTKTIAENSLPVNSPNAGHAVVSTLAEAVRADPKGFERIHWQNLSPAGWFDEPTLERVSLAWENPNWVDVTLHSYRAR